MEYFYGISLVVAVGLWSLALAWRLDFGKISAWQLHRKRQRFNSVDQLFLRRWQAYPLIRTVIAIASGALASWCWVLVFQLQPNVWWAIVGWLGLWLVVLILARLKISARVAERWYLKIEPKLLPHLEKIAKWRLPLFDQPVIKPPHLASRREFEYLIEQDQTILSQLEKAMLNSLVQFEAATVGEVMLSLNQLIQLEADELLGPLKINELYETEQRFFLVKQAERILGLIELEQLTEIKTSHSYKACDLVQTNFPEIVLDETLPRALAQLAQQKYNLAVVCDDREIVGLIELKTILAYLKLIDL